MPNPLTLTAADVRAAMGRDEWVVFLPVKPEPEPAYGNPPETHGRKSGEIFVCVDICPDDKLPVFIEHAGPGMSHVMGHDVFAAKHCPLGKPGDEVVGIERIRLVETGDGMLWAGNVDESAPRKVKVEYVADGALSDWLPYPARLEYREVGESMRGWRETSRFRWTVSAVSVVRIQDVGEADAFAYGIQSYVDSTRGRQTDGTARGAFREMWSARYSPEQWQRNVGCWRVGLSTLTPARAGRE